MAHVEKYKTTQVAAMQRHYARENENYSNPHIRPDRRERNYNLAPVRDVQDAIRSAQTAQEARFGKKMRKDTVVMADWVLTRPGDLRDDIQTFFECAYRFMASRYGEENVLSAWVHMDETTPHMHFSFMPIREGRFCAKKVLDRNELLRFHGELSDAIECQLGYRVAIQLDDSEALKKSLSGLRQDDYIRVKQSVSELKREAHDLKKEIITLQKQKEFLHRDVSELEPIAAAINHSKVTRGNERRGIFREIVTRCDGLRTTVQRFVSGIFQAIKERNDAEARAKRNRIEENARQALIEYNRMPRISKPERSWER